MLKVCFVVLFSLVTQTKLVDSQAATQCALAILSMTGEVLDKDARLKLLGAISEMPEGVDIVKWLYRLLVKSMLHKHYNTNKQTYIHPYTPKC